LRILILSAKRMGRIHTHLPRKGMSNVAETIIMLPDFLETLPFDRATSDSHFCFGLSTKVTARRGFQMGAKRPVAADEFCWAPGPHRQFVW
jgi:hypothetical protein